MPSCHKPCRSLTEAVCNLHVPRHAGTCCFEHVAALDEVGDQVGDY